MKFPGSLLCDLHQTTSLQLWLHYINSSHFQFINSALILKVKVKEGVTLSESFLFYCVLFVCLLHILLSLGKKILTQTQKFIVLALDVFKLWGKVQYMCTYSEVKLKVDFYKHSTQWDSQVDIVVLVTTQVGCCQCWVSLVRHIPEFPEETSAICCSSSSEFVNSSIDWYLENG